MSPPDLLVRLFRRGRLGELLETLIIPKWIEHRIEPEQRGAADHCAFAATNF
jgi:hypothetical protein